MFPGKPEKKLSAQDHKKIIGKIADDPYIVTDKDNRSSRFLPLPHYLHKTPRRAIVQ
jgi:hypothetical protein